MIDYANLNIGGISCEMAGSKIFGTAKRVTKNVSRAHLFAAKSYAEEIRATVTDDCMMPNVDDLVVNLLSEFEDVLIVSERLLHHNVVDSKVYIPNTYNFELTDIMSAADQLMFAYATKSMSAYDYRNSQPYVMVQVRQIIENAAFNSIGVKGITTRNGGFASGVITDSLKFLSDSKVATNYSIKLPLDPVLLLLLYRWSCSFVHKGTLASGYIIFFAYFLTKKLLQQPLAPVRVYDGSFQLKYAHGDIRIDHFDEMKLAYTNKLNPNGKLNIEWLSVGNVGAYIISI